MAPVVLLAMRDVVLAAAYDVYLAAEGFRVSTVTTALECLEELRRSPPRLLVLDLDIPWGGGLGILALLADGSELQPIPVMVVTDRPDAIASELTMGWPLSVMLKPLDPAAFAAVVRAVCPAADLGVSVVRRPA